MKLRRSVAQAGQGKEKTLPNTILDYGVASQTKDHRKQGHIPRCLFALLAFGIASPTVLLAADSQVNKALEYMDLMLYEEAVVLLDHVLFKDPAQPGLRTRQAFAYYRMNRAEKAVEVLNKELEFFPNDFRALILLSFVQYKSGNLEEAEKTAERFQNALEKTFKKKEEEAKALKIRNFEKSLREYRKEKDTILKPLFPNAGVPAYILALRAIERHDSKAARSLLIEAQGMSYFPTDCWIQAIRAEMDQENWPEALRLCQSQGDITYPKEASKYSGRAQDPSLLLGSKKKIELIKTAEIHLLMGIIYEELGRPEEAMECLKTAAALKPFDAEILKNLAIAHLNRKESDDAGPLLQRAAKLKPLDFYLQMLLEQVQNERRRPDGAAMVALSMNSVEARDVRFRYVFETDPDRIANGTNVKALLLIKQGLVLDAIRWLLSFIEIYENSPTIYYNLGQLYNTQDLNHEALKFGLKTIELKHDYRDALDLVGNVCLKMRDFDFSIRFYAQALRLDPKDPVAYFNLGCAYSEAGDAANAEKNWLEAIRAENAPRPARIPPDAEADVLKIAVTVKVDPISSPACQFLASLYVDQGKKEQAFAYLIKAVEFNPKNPIPYFEIAKLYLEQNEMGKAQEYFNRYISLGGDENKVKAFIKKKA